MKTRRTPACAAFSMKFGIRWHKRVDLDRKADRQALADPQLDHPVEQLFPMPVAGEIVVGDEEPLDALRVVFPDRAFEIVGRAEPALATLDVDDRAERALVGAAAPEIEARQRARNPPDVPWRQDRRRLPFERGEVVHEIVERLERAIPGVAHDPAEPALLRLAGKKGNAQRLRRAHLRRHLGQHRDEPETWKPPMQTGSPAARNGRARSTARGNWFDWTPTNPISARPPSRRIVRMIRWGLTRWLVSS